MRPEQKRPRGFLDSEPRKNDRRVTAAWAQQSDLKLAKFAKPVVLVVEDEAVLMMYAVGIVEDAGFEAVEANSADGARSSTGALISDN